MMLMGRVVVAAAPQFAAAVRIVTAQFVAAGNEQLLLTLVFKRNGGAEGFSRFGHGRT